MNTSTHTSGPSGLSAREQDLLRASPFHLDPQALDWVAATRTRLTQQQKLRQLFNHGLHGDDLQTAREAAALGLGAYTRFVGPDMDAAWQATRALLEAADVPPLISGDLEGGAIAMPFASRLPNQLGLAATGDADLAERAVEVIAREARALGYNWSFTPVVDINAAFRSAIVATRSYGSNRDTVLDLARRNIATFQRHGIAATAKHWPGEGFDDRDQHLVTTINPLQRPDWEHHFGRNYRQLIDNGVMAVMAGHIAWPAYAREQGAQGLETCRPASVSDLLNLRLLRGELGFNGVIVSDASGMGGLSAWAPRAQVVADVFNGGCDMLLFPSPFETDLAHLEHALERGLVPWARIEDALLRVLGLKAALGLHRKSIDERLPPLPQVRTVVRSAPHLEIERRAASASVTLVKDVQHLLPLSPVRHRRVVLVTEPDRSGFAFQAPPALLLPELLASRGFECRPFDAEHPPTPEDTDLVLYLLAQESLLTRSHIFLDWARMQGSLRTSMKRYWHELPCALVSLGHPYYLYDAPRMPCVVNAYCATPAVQEAVLRKLLGEEPFTACSPVDATCGLPDAMH